MALETISVVPKCNYANIDNSVGTVSVNRAVSTLMCTTDIDSKRFSTVHRQRIEQVIEKERAKHSETSSVLAVCRAGMKSYGLVRCEMTVGFESESDLRKKFNEYAKFTIGLILALDELAAEL